MGLVCNAGAVIRCSHGGTVTVIPSQQRLKPGGQPVLVESDLMRAAIAGCTNTDARAGQVPCLRIVSVTAGLARRLKVGGEPVVLEDASGRTTSTPPGSFSISSAGQTKLRAS